MHSDTRKRYFKLNIIYLDNSVDIISHFTRVCYGLYLNLSTLFDLTCKCENVMKDLLLKKQGQSENQTQVK